MKKMNELEVDEPKDLSELDVSDSEYYTENDVDSDYDIDNKYNNKTSKKTLRVEYEGVTNIVSCSSLNYPPPSVELDLDILNKTELWEDLSFESKNQLPQLFELSQDILAVRVYTLFNTILKNEEFSDRGLYLSKLAIKFNPADYTSWYYRTECIKRFENKLKIDLEEELNFSRKITYESLKSFQPWAYRRFICSTGNKPFNEIEYVKMEIATSCKNQCAWSHLTWLIRTFGITDLLEEFKFVNFLTCNDPYNNSAWNYKNFLFKFNKTLINKEFVIREFLKDFQKFLEKPKSESICSYLIDMSEFVESMYSGCLNSALEFLQDEIDIEKKDTDQYNLVYTHGLDKEHTCQGPVRECIATILKSISPTAQILRFLKTIKIDEQVTEQLMIVDPMRADFYQSCQWL